MTDCSVCCEKFNRSNRKAIVCQNCDEDEGFIACQSCCRQYILDSPNEPKCMSCKTTWDREFMCDNFTKSFIAKELKEHRENIFYEKQVARLPETQNDAKKAILIESLEQQKNLIQDKIRKLHAELNILKQDRVNICNTIADTLYNSTKDTQNTHNFSFKCPIENCNGYLDSKYVCGICDKKICKDCFEEKLEDHECDPEKKETVKMIKKDTKPCPKCAEMIFKIDGCDQMYCIKCHTAFSWKTGEIENKHIHNPEYFRFLRENNMHIPRNPEDLPNACNDRPQYARILLVCRNYFPSTFNDYRHVSDTLQTITFANMYQVFAHSLHMRQTDERETEEDRDKQLKQLRIEYILNKITRETFKTKIQQIFKRKENNDKNLTIWNFLNIVLGEYLGKVCELNISATTQEDGCKILQDILDESKQVIKYANNAFYKIGKTFNTVYCGLTPNWKIIHNYERFLKDNAKPLN